MKKQPDVPRRRSSTLIQLLTAVCTGLLVSAALVRILCPPPKEPDFYSAVARRFPKKPSQG